MATIKTYTDIEQSKKLAEILPLESADMSWYLATKGNPKAMFNEGYGKYGDFELPCWSLAVLLDYLSANFRVDIKYLDNYWELDCRVHSEYAKELLDACVDMIICLNELKMS